MSCHNGMTRMLSFVQLTQLMSCLYLCVANYTVVTYNEKSQVQRGRPVRRFLKRRWIVGDGLPHPSMNRVPVSGLSQSNWNETIPSYNVFHTPYLAIIIGATVTAMTLGIIVMSVCVYRHYRCRCACTRLERPRELFPNLKYRIRYCFWYIRVSPCKYRIRRAFRSCFRTCFMCCIRLVDNDATVHFSIEDLPEPTYSKNGPPTRHAPQRHQSFNDVNATTEFDYASPRRNPNSFNTHHSKARQIGYRRSLGHTNEGRQSASHLYYPSPREIFRHRDSRSHIDMTNRSGRPVLHDGGIPSFDSVGMNRMVPNNPTTAQNVHGLAALPPSRFKPGLIEMGTTNPKKPGFLQNINRQVQTWTSKKHKTNRQDKEIDDNRILNNTQLTTRPYAYSAKCPQYPWRQASCKDNQNRSTADERFSYRPVARNGLDNNDPTSTSESERYAPRQPRPRVTSSFEAMGDSDDDIESMRSEGKNESLKRWRDNPSGRPQISGLHGMRTNVAGISTTTQPFVDRAPLRGRRGTLTRNGRLCSF